jgi:hypothetical protein
MKQRKELTGEVKGPHTWTNIFVFCFSCSSCRLNLAGYLALGRLVYVPTRHLKVKVNIILMESKPDEVFNEKKLQ